MRTSYPETVAAAMTVAEVAARLRSARSMLRDDLRREFGRGKMNAKAARFTADSGRFSLVWRPVATTRGTVEVVTN